MHFHEHVAAPPVPLDPLPRNAELLTVLRSGWNLQHHASAVQRLHPDLRAEQRLGQVDRDHADQIERPLAPEEAIGLDLDYHDDVALPLRPLSLEPQPGAVIRARRHSDHQALLDRDLAVAVARRTALRRHLALAAAHGAGPLHAEATLPERARPFALALGAR